MNKLAAGGTLSLEHGLSKAQKGVAESLRIRKEVGKITDRVDDVMEQWEVANDAELNFALGGVYQTTDDVRDKIQALLTDAEDCGMSRQELMTSLSDWFTDVETTGGEVGG